MRLEDLTEVIGGLPFRSRVENQADGAFIVVQARDLTDEGSIALDGAARVRSLPSSAKGFLRTGDVVFQPRGTRFSAAKFEAAELPAVAAAPLFVFRPDQSRVSSEFLVSLFQSQGTQAALKQAAAGTYVPQVPRQAIEDLHIELPDLSSQAMLVDLARLGRRETQLTDRLRELRASLFGLAVKQAVKKTRRHQGAPGLNPTPESAATPKGPLSN